MATESLASAQYFIFVTQIHFCCMYAVVIWDWLVSLPREWRFIWKTRWTAIKFAYIFCRYWVIAVIPYILNAYLVNHSMDHCEKIFKIPVALAMWNQAGAEVVLLIRTYAFFNRNRYLLCAMCAVLSSVLGYQLFVAICKMAPLPFVTPPFDQGPCFPMELMNGSQLLGFFLAPLAFDTTVTGLTLWKAFRIRREHGAPSSPIIQTFLKEGIFYYILISVGNLVNGIFYLQPRQSMAAINIPLSIMFPDVLACRLILDLRERGYELSQPSVFPAEGGKFFNGIMKASGETASTAVESMTSKRSCKSPMPLSYTTTRTVYNEKSKGLRGFIERATSGGRNMTTTVDSCMITSECEAHHGGEGGMKETEDVINVGTTTCPVSSYHIIDMPAGELSNGVPLSGIRIDVEKTEM